MAGDEVQVATTFDSFYGARYRDAVRLAYVITADASVAEDVAQDALLRVRPRFETLRDPWPYARAAIVNGARSHLRRRRREEVRLRAAADVQPTATSSHPLELLDAIDRLPFRQKAVIVQPGRTLEIRASDRTRNQVRELVGAARLVDEATWQEMAAGR